MNPYSHLAAPRAAAWLPLAYLLHLVEEWFGGFTEWTRLTPIYDVSVDRFIVINAVAFACVSIATLVAFRIPRTSWICVSLAALFGLNGALHVLATIAWGYYSPGMVTGAFLYVPLAARILRSASPQYSRGAYIGVILFGVFLHAVVAVIAALEGS